MDELTPDSSRELILLKARELFLTLGYHKTSMRSIAQAAKLSTGPLYFHFRNKSEIFFHICCQAHERQLAGFRLAAAQKISAGLRLRSVFYAYWDFFHTEPQYFEILHLTANPMAGIDLPPQLQQILREKRSESISILEQIIREGVAAGELKPFEPRSLALFLYSSAEGVVLVHQNGVLAGCQRDLETVIDTAVGVIGGGMVLVHK